MTKETLRRLLLTFANEKSAQVKFQISNLALAVYKQDCDDKLGEGLFKFAIKVASLDENLIVKQKSRLLLLVLETEGKAIQSFDIF